MRILFCSQTHLSKELGAAKVVIELAEEMERLGWRCEMICPADLLPDNGRNARRDYSEYLRTHLRKYAREFDVVEYDHNHLPHPRSEFPPQTLFVARSVLLAHHFNNIAIPGERGLMPAIRAMTIGRAEATREQAERGRSHVTVLEADLVNVANSVDKAELVRSGISANKIAVIPYGISRTRRLLFDNVSSEAPKQPKVAFVGTFDNRKGATDFPEIVRGVCAAVPEVCFRLMGTSLDCKRVQACFPAHLRNRVEVIPRYDPNDLPALLASCAVGIFPSYIEGFGFGVLEMLAASVPVVAYNSPGPPMMLPPEYLVPRGDTKAMISNVVQLLQDRGRLLQARHWAKQRSQHFQWDNIALETSRLYTESAHARRFKTVLSAYRSCQTQRRATK